MLQESVKYQPVKADLQRIETFMKQAPHKDRDNIDQLSPYLNSTFAVIAEAFRIQRDVLLSIVGER